jgi:hypothetical protein
MGKNMQNTFTEQDAKDFAEFINFVWTKMILDSPENKDAFEFSRLYTKAAQLKKKVEDNIMELKEVIPPPKNPVVKKDKK